MKKAQTPKKAAKAPSKKTAKPAKKATKKKAATKAATKPAVTKKAAKKAAQSAVAKKAPKKATKKAAKKMPAVKAVKATKKAALKKAVKKATPKKAVSRPVAAPPKAAKKAPKKAAKKAAAKAKPAAPAAAPPVEPTTTAPAAAAAPTPALAPLPTPVTTPESPDETLLEIARLLYDKAAFHEEVRLAVEHPEEYVERFFEDLEQRNISSPVPSLPWIALIDSLRRHDVLVALDWTFEPDELAEGLAAVLETRGERPVDLTLSEGYSESTEALQMLGDQLLEAGLALVTIDSAEPEDAFPVTVIDADAVEAAARLAMQLGLGSIQRWSSEDQE